MKDKKQTATEDIKPSVNKIVELTEKLSEEPVEQRKAGEAYGNKRPFDPFGNNPYLD